MKKTDAERQTRDARKKPAKNKLENQVKELTEDLQRVQADFVNFKRRAETDLEQRGKLGQKQALAMLLPTIDNIERAMGHMPKELSDNAWAQGVAKTATQLKEDLNKIGVVRIETLDRHFDPDLMDAVQVEGEGEKEIVVEELQSGYMINGEVLRHAVVKVRRSNNE